MFIGNIKRKAGRAPNLYGKREGGPDRGLSEELRLQWSETPTPSPATPLCPTHPEGLRSLWPAGPPLTAHPAHSRTCMPMDAHVCIALMSHKVPFMPVGCGTKVTKGVEGTGSPPPALSHPVPLKASLSLVSNVNPPGKKVDALQANTFLCLKKRTLVHKRPLTAHPVLRLAFLRLTVFSTRAPEPLPEDSVVGRCSHFSHRRRPDGHAGGFSALAAAERRAAVKCCLSLHGASEEGELLAEWGWGCASLWMCPPSCAGARPGPPEAGQPGCSHALGSWRKRWETQVSWVSFRLPLAYREARRLCAFQSYLQFLSGNCSYRLPIFLLVCVSLSY